MAAYEKQIQFLRGSTVASEAYTGVAGSISVDTTKKTLRVHDGATAGGSVLAKEAIKLKTDSDNLVKFNGAAEADHSADISITIDKEAISSEVLETIKTDEDLKAELAEITVDTIKADDTLKDDVAGAVLDGLTASADKQEELAKLIADDLVSTDSDNAVEVGDDGKLFVEKFDINAVVASGDKVLFVNDDDAIATNLKLTITESTNTLNLLGGADGTTTVASVTLPSGGLLEEAKLVQEKPVEGGDPQTGEFIYLKFKLADGSYSEMYIDVTKLVDIYTAGDGLQTNASDNHKFEAKVASTGNLLKIDDSKALFVPTDFGTLD